MIDSKTVTIIIVTFNSEHCLPDLLRTLPEKARIIIVDNASDTDPTQIATQIRPDITIIRNKENLGFGRANNIALNQTNSQFALLLNPDCLLKPSCLDELLRTAHAMPGAAAFAPHLFRGDGRLELSYRWPSNSWGSRGPEAEAPCCVGFASGAALLLNMEVMRKIGFFDESFFLYYEDEDLCQRIFCSKNSIVIVPSAIATHFSRGSVRGKSPLKSEFIRGHYHAQSKLIFEGKHVGNAEAVRLRWKTLALALLTLLPRLLLPQPKYLARLLGRIAGLWNYAPRGSRPIK